MTALAQIEQQAYDRAEQLVASILAERTPSVDVRRGTAVHALVVRPYATLDAVNTARSEDLLRSRSLRDMLDNGVDDRDAIDSVLGNFMTQLDPGLGPRGDITLYLLSEKDVTISYGTVFRINGSDYMADGEITLAEVGGDADIEKLGDGYIATIRVTSVDASVEAPAAMTVVGVSPAVPGLISAVTAHDFLVSSPAEEPAEAMGRLGTAMSYRGLGSARAIEAALRDYSPDVRAVSVQGFGSKLQRRDINPSTGASSGGQVDVFCRTFGEPVSLRVDIEGSHAGGGVYILDVPAHLSRGVYAIGEISCACGDARLASVEYSAAGDNVPRYREGMERVDLFGTTYQKLRILVSSTSGEDASIFSVQLYTAPGLQSLQSSLGGAGARAGYVVRSPLVVRVSMVSAATLGDVSLTSVRAKLAAFINEQSFTDRLELSDIIGIMHGLGVRNIDASNTKLSGRLFRPDGRVLAIEGGSLNVGTIEDTSMLVAPESCVFACAPGDIDIRGR